MLYWLSEIALSFWLFFSFASIYLTYAWSVVGLYSLTSKEGGRIRILTLSKITWFNFYKNFCQLYHKVSECFLRYTCFKFGLASSSWCQKLDTFIICLLNKTTPFDPICMCWYNCLISFLIPHSIYTWKTIKYT